eukprot:4797312-Pyramimonas_sp.AAC.1
MGAAGLRGGALLRLCWRALGELHRWVRAPPVAIIPRQAQRSVLHLLLAVRLGTVGDAGRVRHPVGGLLDHVFVMVLLLLDLLVGLVVAGADVPALFALE